MSYFRESFEYQPIKLFLNSNAADNVQSRGDVTFNLRKNICLPSGTIGYVSLNELTIPNTNYNINSSNNKLIITDIDGVTLEHSVDEGNYTVSQLRDNLYTAFQSSVAATFKSINLSYDDITNKFTFSSSTSGAFHITSGSTINSVLGFESDINIDFAPYNVQNTSIVTDEDVSGLVVIDNTNNVFEFMYDGGYTYSYTFPAGMYSIANIASALNVVLGRYGISVVYEPNTERVTFSSATLVKFTLKCVPYNILDELGFADDTIDHESNVGSTSCSLTSSRIVDLSGNNSFYVTTNLGLGNYSFLNSNNTGGANVLAKIQSNNRLNWY